MRKRTLTGGGCGHFVTFSVMGRRKLLASPRARQIVIGHLGKLADQGRVHVTGFVIMPDHVHAILWFDDDRDLPEVMKVWKTESSRSLRGFYREQGPEVVDQLKVKRSGREFTAIWQRRYYDFNLRSREKIDQKLSYMHYNPVKAGLCSRMTDWAWSSARFYYLRRNVGVKIEPGYM